MWNLLPLFSLLLFLASCTPSTKEASNAETKMEHQEPVTQNMDVPTNTIVSKEHEEAPLQYEEPQATMAARQASFSPIDQRVEMVPEVLGALCQNKYGCIAEVIYPLGWSTDGKFAYLLEAANEAVNDYTLQLFIQDMETDKIATEKTWKASDQTGWSEEQNYNFASVWSTAGVVFRELLEAHQIQEGNGNDFIRLPFEYEDERYTFESQDKMVLNDYTGSNVVDEHELVAVANGLGQKRIVKQTFGKYDMVQRTQALGLFKSPFEDRVAVLDGAEYRGFEGPPNILKFKLVGCSLKDGF